MPFMLCSEPASNDHFQTQTGAALCYVSCTVVDHACCGATVATDRLALHGHQPSVDLAQQTSVAPMVKTVPHCGYRRDIAGKSFGKSAHAHPDAARYPIAAEKHRIMRARAEVLASGAAFGATRSAGVHRPSVCRFHRRGIHPASPRRNA